jgi:hypothetical protein
VRVGPVERGDDPDRGSDDGDDTATQLRVSEDKEETDHDEERHSAAQRVDQERRCRSEDDQRDHEQRRDEQLGARFHVLRDSPHPESLAVARPRLDREEPGHDGF